MVIVILASAVVAWMIANSMATASEQKSDSTTYSHGGVHLQLPAGWRASWQGETQDSTVWSAWVGARSPVLSCATSADEAADVVVEVIDVTDSPREPSNPPRRNREWDEESGTGLDGESDDACGDVQEIPFTSGGRQLLARVIVADGAHASLVADAYRILNTARF